jgi:hypothetical protein
VTALFASPWVAPVVGFVCLAAVATGVYLGAAWDRLADHMRARYTPNGAHRR